MPPASRRQKQSANHHDKRHESGLAQPAKRISKEKANGQPNGVVKKDHSNNDAITGEDSRLRKDSEGDVDVPVGEIEGGTGAVRGWEHCGVEDDNMKNTSTASGDVPAELEDTRYSANGAVAAQISRTATNPTDRRSMVIGSHSLGDVIAILLLLLQLPPALLVSIQFCFALVTIGNSYSGISLSSLTQWSHSHGGNPSIVAIALADLCILAGWAIIPWPWLKEIALDLAQVVVAMSLGGGGSSIGSATYGAVCVGIIATSHLFRKRTLRESAINFLASVLPRAGIGTVRLVSAIPLVPTSSYSTRGWTRTLLEIHIIAQGIVRIIRRAHSRRIEPTPPPRNAQESAAASNTSNSTLADPEGSRNASTDGRPPGPSPSQRERERTVSSGKKRRKQATLVRSQQPFWAAIATTKVSVSKEYEQSHYSRDNFEAGSRDVNHLGDALSNCLGDRVWISKINDNDLWFSAIIWTRDNATQSSATASSSPNWSNDGDDSEISLRVNGAIWNSFVSSEDEQFGDRKSLESKLLKGKIFGLTPLTGYFIEFIRAGTDQIIFSTNLLTRPVATSDQGVPAAPPPRQSLQPLSPTTTLKQSIAAAENNLNEQRARAKKIRKDHRSSTAALRKEVDNLDNRLSTTGGTDDRQRQRGIQFKQSIRQAEESASALATQIEDLGDIPESEQKTFAKTKQEWETARSQHAALKDDLDKAKSECDQRLNAIKAEVAATRRKRERGEGRLSHLEQQRDFLVSANEQTRRDKVQRENNRASVVASQAAREQSLLDGINKLHAHRQQSDAAIADMEQQIHMYEATFANAPLTQSPDSATNMTGVPFPPPKTSFPYSMGTGLSRSRQGSLQQKPRGRSSSMLSDISGFTDEETGGAHHPNHVAPDLGAIGGDASHQLSHKRGSASGSDPASSPAPRLSPIGTDFRRGSPRHSKRSS